MFPKRNVLPQLPLVFLLVGLVALLCGVAAREPFSGVMGWLLMLNGGLLQVGALIRK